MRKIVKNFKIASSPIEPERINFASLFTVSKPIDSLLLSFDTSIVAKNFWEMRVKLKNETEAAREKHFKINSWKKEEYRESNGVKEKGASSKALLEEIARANS